jgi:hypothetical protein
MRRDQLILLLQPYKNGLMHKKALSESINRFARFLLDLCGKYPRLRFNIVLPGYILECIDPLIASSLREMAKRGSVEWLSTGYTEPFLSFSPLWLTGENISWGTKVFTELTGEAPTGFAAPFSNWEPSHIDMLSAAGLKYAVVSSVLLAKNEANRPGYWITEHTGSSMAVFPAHSYHIYNAPKDLAGWIKESFPEDKPEGASRIIVLKYFYPLEPKGDYQARNHQHKKQQAKNNQPKDNHPINPNAWIEQTAAEIDKRILELHPLRFKDVLGNTPPLGLHYIPSSLVPSHNESATPYFLNHLHCYDQIGLMQRKMMEVSDGVRELKESKTAASLKRQLFFAQDINRFLPSEEAGFCSISDRLWTYGKLIDIERGLYGLKNEQGGIIRLTDFLRNGYKSIIMSNRALKMYIDHKNGAQAYEIDYRERSYNACAAYNPGVRTRANVIVSRESRLGFSDKIFTEPISVERYMKGAVKDCANFSDSPFEYIFKNSPSGVKVLLNCNGGFTDSGRNFPLLMDKVFGLEKDDAILSFSYKLGNTSLTDYSLIMGIELPLALPGCAHGNARVIGGKKKINITGKEPIVIDDITDWEIEDEEVGVRMEFVTQKKVNIWIFSPDASSSPENKNTNGVTLFMSFPLEIEQNSTALFTGRMSFKKLRTKGAFGDSL